VFQAVFEPIILRGKTNQQAGRLAVPSKHNLFSLRQTQELGQVVSNPSSAPASAVREVAAMLHDFASHVHCRCFTSISVSTNTIVALRVGFRFQISNLKCHSNQKTFAVGRIANPSITEETQIAIARDRSPMA
jgi:hypothetical protein